MTNDELKAALFSGCPVEHGGIVYKCVSAIIYRCKNGELVISAELTDKNNNSVSIVEPSRVTEVNIRQYRKRKTAAEKRLQGFISYWL